MYKLDVLVSDDFQITKVSEKKFYNLKDKISLSDWIRSKKFKMTIPSFATTNGVRFTEKNKIYKVPVHYLGYIHDHSNNVQNNTSGIGMYTTMFSDAHGTFFDEDNFMSVISAFASRIMIQSTWVNEKDEYMKPNTQLDNYESFNIDSLIISLFSNASFQSSLRNVSDVYNIKNEFFWMSTERMKELSDQKGYDELYNDARTSSDRYVYKLLFGEERIYDKLSPDAKLVLDKATELVEKSMELRQTMANDENHLDSWDAGYAQLKLVWKEYFQEDFKEFRQLYKNLEDRMRPLVYELGFLMK
jgi:hypothetical protein